VVSLSTIVSAMTAYSLNNAAFIPDGSNNLISFNDIEEVLFVIHDGTRANLSNETMVMSSNVPDSLFLASIITTANLLPVNDGELSKNYWYTVMMLIVIVCTMYGIPPTEKPNCEIWANITLCKTILQLLNFRLRFARDLSKLPQLCHLP
jgi:hypothetical protein